jgi:hypothetical protein
LVLAPEPIDPLHRLRDEACKEAYEYFDRHIRKLVRRANGQINPFGPGLDDNDVDAFRHAYVSGVFTQDFGEKVANYLGLANEYWPGGQYSHSVSPGSRNMDLWNNKVGRRYGKTIRSRKTLLKAIHNALKKGELILNPKDPREFTGAKSPPDKLSKPIVAVAKSKSGRNEIFYDIEKRVVLSREDLVAKIEMGFDPGYSVKIIRGIETPVSKRDGRIANNIG